MLNRIRRLLRRVDAEQAAQRQREALLDLLIWTMYADNVLSLSENERLEDAADDITWESVQPVKQYINEAFSRIRTALDDEERAEELLESIHDRLETDEMRARAYETCHELAESDGSVASGEISLLSRVRERFGIERRSTQ